MTLRLQSREDSVCTVGKLLHMENIFVGRVKFFVGFWDN